jgi:RHS repeat-associated protein
LTHPRVETRFHPWPDRVVYDAAGRKTADIDPDGRRTEYAYDANGRLEVVRLAAGTSEQTTTSYAYDEAGNKIRQTDAEGRVTRWEYDSMGREIARVLPQGQRESKSWNAAGELDSSTDFNGQITRYHYDVTGRLASIDYPHDADVSFTYNAAGERTAVLDGRGNSTMSYDAHGRVLQSLDAEGGQIEYQYDAAGNLLARISPSQSLVYAYDARNRLDTVTRTIDGEAPSVTRYTYDEDGNRTTMIGGSTQTEYGYDSRHRLRSLIKRTAASALLLAMNYSVDATGLRTHIEESDPAGIVRTVDYQYDSLKRLTDETIDHREDLNDRSSHWVYDRVGNRLQQVVSIGGLAPNSTDYSYDGNDRLATSTSNGEVTSYTYDANGNTTSKTQAGDLTTYTYNDANRLIQASTASGTTRYVYNADGLRTRQTHTPTGGTESTTWYVQDSAYPYAQVIEEYQSQASGPKTLSATYTFADDLVSQTRYDSAGTPTTSYIQADGFGSTRWLTDAAGTITDSIDYDAFGVEIRRSGTAEIEHLYRGERFDPNLAMYDLRARLYEPANGRFLTQDSFAGFGIDPRSLHKYGYTHGDPVNNTDPSGNATLAGELTGISGGLIVGLGVRAVSAGAGILIGSRINNIIRSRTAARVCAATFSSGLRAFDSGDCPEVRMPIVFMSEVLMPGIGEHVAESQAMGSPAVLNRTGLLRTTNRGVALAKCALGMDIPVQNGGSSCDEYPFASTYQGGLGSTVAKVRLLSNWTQGGVLSGFYNACIVTPDIFPTNEFLVLPVASSPGSNFQCRFFGPR